MTLLRSLLFNVAFFAWTAVYQLACLPVLLGPPRWAARVGEMWVRTGFAMLAGIVGLRSEVRGRENLPDGPCLVASKHQSAWDTLIFSQLLDAPAYVVKQELTWVPLFGWYLQKLGVVAIDRAGGSKALRRMVAEARAAVAAGRSIVIFPEGTRTPPGMRRAYHPGVAALYRELGLPVVPVALNSGLFWGRRAFRKRSGTIVLEFLPPIPPGLPRREFMARLERALEGAADRLAGLAPASRGDEESRESPGAARA